MAADPELNHQVLEPARLEEAAACLDLLVINGDREPLPCGEFHWTRPRLEPMVHADAKAGRLYVVRDRGTVIATLALCEPVDDYLKPGRWSATPDRALLLHRLAIRPDRQRQRLGDVCVREAERIAARAGAEYLWLDALEHQPKVLGFYRRLNYREVGVARVNTGEPRNPEIGLVLFEKRLTHD
jgi:GNAT superfamily N-acetyltransferase